MNNNQQDESVNQNEQDEQEEILLKIPTSIFKTQMEEEKPSPSWMEGNETFQQFERTNIQPATAKRHTEHGWAEIKTLAFVTDEQRQKALSFLSNPFFYDNTLKLLDYICFLGHINNGEIRYHAAAATGTLVDVLPFLELKAKVIYPWAQHESPFIRKVAAKALSLVVENEYHQSEAINLLKIWVRLPNSPNGNDYCLVDTTLETCHLIAMLQPVETLEIIEIALKNGILTNPNISTPLNRAVEILRNIFDFEPELVINKLNDWLDEDQEKYVRSVTGILFLSIVLLSPVARDEAIQEIVVNMIFLLWEDPNLLVRLKLQEATTKLVKNWAEAAISTQKKFDAYHRLFYDLYDKYEGRRKNRLENYLQRWQKGQERSQARSTRRGRSEPSESSPLFNFLDLIPSQSLK